VADVTGFTGTIEWDHSKPDGAPRKLMDSSKLRSLGWQPAYDLKTGLEDAYRWFLDNQASVRR
jgi:GDP-L-fucose synthase